MYKPDLVLGKQGSRIYIRAELPPTPNRVYAIRIENAILVYCATFSQKNIR